MTKKDNEIEEITLKRKPIKKETTYKKANVLNVKEDNKLNKEVLIKKINNKNNDSQKETITKRKNVSQIELDKNNNVKKDNLKEKPKKANNISLNEEVPKRKKNVKKILKDDNVDLELESKDKFNNNSRVVSNKKSSKTKNTTTLENNFKNNEPKLVKKKRKLKKKFKVLLIVLLITLIVSLIIVGINIFLKYQKKLENDRLIEERAKIVKKIESHYNNYVKANKDAILYQKDENSNYYEDGMIYEGVELILDEIKIDYLTEYFYSKNLEAYIKFSDVSPINELSVYDKRYKNYVVFNQNVVTKDQFSLYDNNKKVYTFNHSMKFPIIINNDEGKYYVEFNDRLLYVLKDDIKEIVKANNTKINNASKVTTLCYHRIYDASHKCNDLYICKSKSNFEREMKYLSDNKFFTLTMNEMYLYLTKKIQIPRKSVVLTFDDGTLFEIGIDILEKYNLHGTGFIKTGTFNDYSIYESPNFELQSHTDKMHVAGTCPRETSVQQGGGILCLSEQTVLKDLKLSRDKLDGAIALAFPFYDYNNRAIALVKKAGFKLAFIGANNVSGRASPGIDLYKVPRMTIWNTTSFDTFKGYVNN